MWARIRRWGRASRRARCSAGNRLPRNRVPGTDHPQGPPDNHVIHVPNSQAWGNVITNVTASDTRRVDLIFGVSYDDDLKAVQRALEETVTAHPLVLNDPEPMIRVNALNSSSIDFICRPWVRGEDYWSVYWDLTRLVKERFDRDGITIPVPATGCPRPRR